MANNDMMPLFGLTAQQAEQHILGGVATPEGRAALTRVLQAAEHTLGLDYCPLLVPIASVWLTSMSESYVFCALRELAHNSSRSMAVSRREHHAFCRAFADILQRLHPQTAQAMRDVGCLPHHTTTPTSPTSNPNQHNHKSQVSGLDPIFKLFCLPILRREHVLRLMDIYCLEGSKTLFRFGVALLCLCKKDLKVSFTRFAQKRFISSLQLRRSNPSSRCQQEEPIATPEIWWQKVRDYTHSEKFDFDFLVKKAYGYHGSRYRKRLRFPRRHIIHRIIRLEEERVDLTWEEDGAVVKPRPLGINLPSQQEDDAGGRDGRFGMLEKDVPIPVLAKPTSIRACLAEWLPLPLRLTKLDLLYSTNHHGRTLERFYNACQSTKHTITLMEVLNNDSIVGFYASQAWRIHPRSFGDGECVLFRAKPNPQGWKWSPPPEAHPSANGYGPGEATESSFGNGGFSSDANTALQEQFMVARSSFLSMGANRDGSCGIRINEDLTRGASAPALGYDNEELPGDGITAFEIGTVEVYRLVRQIDGMPIDT